MNILHEVLRQPRDRSLSDDSEADLAKHAGLMLNTRARCTLQLQSHEVEI